MILVTGATGLVGHHLLEELADLGAPATGLVRVEARGLGLPGGAGYLVGNLDDPGPPDVLRGFDRVFLLSPMHEGQAELEIAFVDSLISAGHRPHVVKLAADGFQDPDCEVRFMRSHRLVARHLDAMHIPVTYIAPNLYMENLLALADEMRDRGLLAVPGGWAQVGFVATSDVAAVAARALVADPEEHLDQVHVVTGPEALSYADVAARVSAVFAREVDYHDQSLAEARTAMRVRGLAPWVLDGMLELHEWARHGGCAKVTGTVRQLTGREPRPFQDWLEELRGAFVGRPQELSPPRF
jgi:uncharacterized protein YbjT (DUF2867 family)